MESSTPSSTTPGGAWANTSAAAASSWLRSASAGPVASNPRVHQASPRVRTSVGFALGAHHVNLAAAAVLIGAVSVILSLAGLEPGDRLGTTTGERGELLGGLVLIAVGIAIASGIL